MEQFSPEIDTRVYTKWKRAVRDSAESLFQKFTWRFVRIM